MHKRNKRKHSCSKISTLEGKLNCKKVNTLRKLNKLRKVRKLVEKVNTLAEREQQGFGATH